MNMKMNMLAVPIKLQEEAEMQKTIQEMQIRQMQQQQQQQQQAQPKTFIDKG